MQHDLFMYHLRSIYKNRPDLPFKVSYNLDLILMEFSNCYLNAYQINVYIYTFLFCSMNPASPKCYMYMYIYIHDDFIFCMYCVSRDFCKSWDLHNVVVRANFADISLTGKHLCIPSMCTCMPNLHLVSP